LKAKKFLSWITRLFNLFFTTSSLLHFLQYISAQRGSVKGQGYRGRSSIAPVPVPYFHISRKLDKLELTLGYSSHVPPFTSVKFTILYKSLQLLKNPIIPTLFELCFIFYKCKKIIVLHLLQ